MTRSTSTWTDHPGNSPPPKTWLTVRGLLVALVVCRGLALVCVLPPFEGWDEYQHVGYVEHIRQTGQAPVLWETSVPKVLLAEALKFPQPECAIRDQLGALGGISYAAYWDRPDAARYRGGSNVLYQAQHSPLAYRLAAPVFAALGGVHNLRSSVAGLRLANVGLTAAAVWVVLGVLRRIVRRDGDAALLGLALAAHPMFLMNGARVANDALGVFLAVIAVGACLSLALGESRRFVPRALGVGLLIGLAVSAKATNLGLLPFAAFVWLAATVRRKPGAGMAVLAGLAMAAGTLAIVQAELRFNFAHYGLVTSMQEAVINHKKGLTRTDLLQTAATIPWAKTLPRLWDRDLFFTGGWSFLPTHPRALRYYRYALFAGLLGWVWHGVALMTIKRSWRNAMFTSAWVPAAFLVLVVGYTAGLAFHMVQSKAAWGVSTTNPWYACAALPWFLAIVSAGGLFWPLGRWGRASLPAALAVICLGSELVGIWGRMVPVYTANATGWEMLRRLAQLQPGALGTATLALALLGEAIVLAALVVVGRDAVASTRPLSHFPGHSLFRRRVPSTID